MKIYHLIGWLLCMALVTAANVPITAESIAKALNKHQMVEADFEQLDKTGKKIAHGHVFLKKPGKLKFLYNDPPGYFIVTSGEWLVFYDPKLDEGTYLPIADTPAGLLLKNKVKFKEDILIEDIQLIQNHALVTLRAQGYDGPITLIFDRKTMTLSGWHTVDAKGESSQVQLKNVRFPKDIKDSHFKYTEQKEWKRNRK